MHGFTLVEILVSIGVVAIVSVALVLLINPIELLKRARDSDRLSDLASINKAIGIYAIEGTYFGSSSVVYVSIPDASSSCDNLGLPTLESPWVYGCSTEANYKNVDGAGWIPLDFNSLSVKPPLNRLPVDPVNSVSGDLYYTYIHTLKAAGNLARGLRRQATRKRWRETAV